jgi:hypothetical protein
MDYKDLRSIDVSKYTEKKNGLTYLSWSYAVDQLLLADPKAYWFYSEPKIWANDTVMVFCTVVSNDVARTAQLPVMDYKNKSISNPDSWAVNTAMQRCLAKAIALHGIGLYIYNGEDVPPDLGIDVKINTVTQQEPKVVSPPKKEAPAKTPVKVALPGEWTLKPIGDDFIGSLQVGLDAMLQLATSPDDVANIFKVNRSTFDKAKEMNEQAYTEMMAKFTATKKSLTKE